MRQTGAVPMHESLRIGLVLTFIGGFLEVYNYLLHGGVFANAQTGNMVLLVIYACEGSAHALYYLWPIGAFFAGVLVSEGIRSALTARQWSMWQHAVVLCEALLLAAIAFLPQNTPDVAVNVLISLICSLQFNSFRCTHGLPYATTFCTGNLRSAGENFFHWAAERDRERGVAAARYFAVIGVFLAGAAAAYFITQRLRGYAVLVCAALAACVFLHMQLRQRRIHEENREIKS